MPKENGKWQLAFWIITVICGVWLVGLTGGVVVNDRIRGDEDQRIEDKTDLKLDKITDLVTEQRVDMGKVMTRLGIDD